MGQTQNRTIDVDGVISNLLDFILKLIIAG